MRPLPTYDQRLMPCESTKPNEIYVYAPPAGNLVSGGCHWHIDCIDRALPTQRAIEFTAISRQSDFDSTSVPESHHQQAQLTRPSTLPAVNAWLEAPYVPQQLDLFQQLNIHPKYVNQQGRIQSMSRLISVGFICRQEFGLSQ